MKSRTYVGSAIAALLAVLSFATNGSQGTTDVRRLLLEMTRNHTSTEQLAVLFQADERQVDVLVRALEDPDPEVKLNAQIVIRYLGNEREMRAWFKLHEAGKSTSFTAPIPIPLQKWDYEFVREFYLRDNVRTEPLLEAYLFALVLDGSIEAEQLFGAVIANCKKHGFNIAGSRFLKVRNVGIDTDNDLAREVFAEASFLSARARQYTTAKLLAYSASKDKALVELFVNGGPLAQEWWHVVLSKHGNVWKFFSITQVAVS